MLDGHTPAMVISDEDGRTSMVLLEQATLITHSALPPTYHDSGIGTHGDNTDFTSAARGLVLRRLHNAKYRCSVENLSRRRDVDISWRHQSVDGSGVVLQPCPRPSLACPLEVAVHAPAVAGWHVLKRLDLEYDVVRLDEPA
jgi:hypothetical protein